MFSNFLTNFTFFEYFFLGTTDDVYSLNYMCFCSIMNRHKVCELWCFHQFDEFSKNQKNKKCVGFGVFINLMNFFKIFTFLKKSVCCNSITWIPSQVMELQQAEKAVIFKIYNQIIWLLFLVRFRTLQSKTLQFLHFW